MPLRVIKVILPGNYRDTALKLIKSQENLNFWIEETSGEHFVVSGLTNSEHSEVIMDLFEKEFISVDGFQLILFPVAGSIPRIDSDEKKLVPVSTETAESEQETILRVSREELYTDIVDSAKLSKIFFFMVILSTIVAAIGLMKNNVAVIIGAMVIAPFLGPNVALALSTNLADRTLGFNAIKTLLSGIIIVLALSIGMGFLFEATPDIPEIASRTHADLSDIVLAIASGCAGVLAFTTGTSTAVIGVMVAVALLPPLTACGLLVGSGFFTQAASAFLLFMTNIICINLAGVVTFWIQGVSPRVWWKADKAKKATFKAFFIWAILLAALSLIMIMW
jgi:uncharacterized hydrophobic protein (TIGR00341 family)